MFPVRFRRVAGVLALLLSLLLLPDLASAQSARDLFMQGTAAYRVGDYEGAIDAWNRAYGLDAQPLLQYNIGQAYERLGRLTEAVAALELYLQTARPDDPQRSDASARLAAMRERLSRTGILVRSDVEGATILVDGEDVARTPRRDPVRVAPGSHVVEVRMTGYQEFRVAVQVAAGGVVEVDASLVALGAGTRGDERLAEAEEPEAPSRFPLGGWILTASGGAMVVAGGVLGLVALGKAKDAPASTGPEADSAQSLALASDILLFGGLGVAAGGVVWLLLDREPREEETQVGHWRVHPVVGPTVLGADARVRF